MTMPENTDQLAAPEGEAPPWGDDSQFDPQKAWNLIQGLRADKEKLSLRPVLTDEQQQKLTEYERLEQASKTELERKSEELTRWQSEAEKWRTASVAAEVRALAATDFADTDDAVRSLDPSKYLDAGGTVDTAAIKADLAALLEAKPHYKRPTPEGAPPSRLPAPNPAQGAGGKAVANPATEFASILQGQLAR